MGDISPIAWLGFAIAVVAVIVIPWVRWCWRTSKDQKIVIGKIDSLTKMHLDPKSQFSTSKTNETLERIETQLDKTNTAQLNVLSEVARGFRELADRVAWAAEQMTGKKIPPYVDRIDG